MTKPANSAPSRGRKWKWLAVALLASAGGLAALCFWFGGVTFGDSDPLFRGKPESVWIKNLKYSFDAGYDEQVKEWRTYGEEGVQVLIRGLRRANHSSERAYRQFYRRLPYAIARRLPPPQQDDTSGARMTIAALLSSLRDEAKSAVPIMIRTVNDDEADSVRQIAIGFFNSSEDEKCLLNQMPPAEKKRLLSGLIRAMQDAGNWGLRNNAANALKWFPEQREIVSPVLV